MFVESNKMELKRDYTKSYLKTVSAFANERNSKVIFGISDDGEVWGVEDENMIRHQIENSINDNFTPIPDFELETQIIEGKKIVVLSVSRGLAIPYFFKGRAYMRTDTSTVVADSFRMRRWFQQILNVDFDEALTDDEELEFNHLQEALKDRIGLTEFTEGTLITLGLKKGEQFTNAGRVFADVNSYKFGVDIVKFGANHSEFIKRLRMTNQSIIKQFNESMDFFDLYYSPYEVVSKGERIERTRIPRNAFREALANAIVHRDYLMNANIQIEFWDTHIRIMSPGGLTSDISEETYLSGGVSVPRNTTIAHIFFRLKIIEVLGTGIGRIKGEYLAFGQEPKFKLAPNIIEIILPIIDYGKKATIEKREIDVLDLLKHSPASRAEIQEKLGISSSTTKRFLNTLLDQDKIERFGRGKGIKYRLL